MPEMDGFEATRRIRDSENDRIRAIPIVALTANALSGDDKKCLAAGMNDYLAKPIKKDALRAAIEKWTARPRQAA
jgi:CheY-like chemotaxis protein